MTELSPYRLHDIKEQYRNAALKLLPCNTLSTIHDLQCGHRVKQVEARNACGSNCAHSSPGSQAFTGAQREFRQEPGPIICPLCTFRLIAREKGIDVLGIHSAEVNVELDSLTGLRLMSSTEVSYNKHIEKMIGQGSRLAEVMVELDNLSELVRQSAHVVIGTASVADTPIVMDGEVVPTEVETGEDPDDFGEAGTDLIWTERKL